MSKKNKIVMLSALLTMSAGVVTADLEWITGGVPKNTTGKTAPNAVPDAPSSENKSPSSSNQDIIVCHLTTCTKIVHQYPFDSQNYFYLNKHNQVGYFAYFLLKPSSRIHTATVEWYSPSDIRIAKYEHEFRVSFTDNLLNIHNETYQWFLLEMVLGLDHLHHEYGQTVLPRDVGLYTIHLSVDGQLSGITFFNVFSEEGKPPTANPTPGLITPKNILPLFTPVSNGPLRRTISPVQQPLTPVPQIQ